MGHTPWSKLRRQTPAEREAFNTWLDDTRRLLAAANEQRPAHVKIHGGTTRFVRHDRVWTFDIRPDDLDGGYIAQCREEPGLLTQADDLVELDANLYGLVDAYMVVLEAVLEEEP